MASGSGDSPAKVTSFSRKAEKAVKLKRIRPAKPGRTRSVYWVALVWLMVLGSIAGSRYVYVRFQEEKRKADSAANGSRRMLENKAKYLDQELVVCDQLLREFMTGGTVEEMGQYVFPIRDFADQAVAFRAVDILGRLNVNSLRRDYQDMFRLGDEWVIWTRWREVSAELEFDVVFRKDASGWKIDWPSFSQFNPVVSWRDFLTGAGPEKSEFKLLVRKLKPYEIEVPERNFMALAFMEPVWGKPQQESGPTTVFMIDEMRKEVQSLSAAFEVKKTNRILYNAKIPPMELADWIRLSVVVSRTELDGKFRFALEEIKACHWVGSSASGYDPERLKMNKF